MASFFKKGEALFGFLRFSRNKHGEVVLRPVLGRILIALTALGLAGWMTAALAVMIFVKQARGFEGGSYVDLLFYPWRKDAYQKAWGDEFIERGQELLNEGEIQEGLHLIRVGHVKSPSNLDGRLFMADLYSARGRQDLAARLLREGLPYAEGDLDYLRKTLRLLISIQEDQAVKDIAEEILSGEPVLEPYHQVLALAAATAHFHRGGYDQAEDYLLRYNLSSNPEGRILLARIDWERGSQQAALDRLERLTDQFTDQDEVYTLLSRYYRELGDHTNAHNYAVMRQISDPLSAAPRVALLYSHHSAGEDSRTAHVAERLLRDFGHDQDALLGLGEFAAHTGDVELCQRVFQAMDRGGFPLHLPAILLAEAHFNAGEYRNAVDFLENHSRDNEKFTDQFAPILDSIFTVAYLGMGNDDAGERHLTRFLDARNLRAESYLLTSDRLLDLGHQELARRVVLHAHQSNPLNQAALTELIRLDLEAGRTADLVTNISKLLTMRKPPRELLETSATTLSADQFLFLPQRREILRSILEVIDETSGAEVVTHS